MINLYRHSLIGSGLMIMLNCQKLLVIAILKVTIINLVLYYLYH